MIPKPYQPTIEDRARHEAGHAIAHLALGLPLTKVEIGEDLGAGNIAGGATVIGRTSGGQPGAEAPAIAVATATWAGPLAECAGHADVPLGVILAVTGSGDMELLRRLNPRWAYDSGPGSPFQRAQSLVLANANAIATLTGLLVEHRQLTAEQIRDSITIQATPKPAPLPCGCHPTADPPLCRQHAQAARLGQPRLWAKRTRG
jgi:hypothetical protein